MAESAQFKRKTQFTLFDTSFLDILSNMKNTLVTLSQNLGCSCNLGSIFISQ